MNQESHRETAEKLVEAVRQSEDGGVVGELARLLMKYNDTWGIAYVIILLEEERVSEARVVLWEMLEARVDHV